MITNIFYSNQNKNAIKAVLNENIGVNTGNKYDIMIKETMDYVSSQVSPKPPKGIPEDEYLMLMNKKVYDIIKPVIKSDIEQRNQKNPQVNKKTSTKEADLYNQYQQYQKNDETKKNKQNKIYQQYKQNGESINQISVSDNVFDPILLKNYETPNVIDYPKPAASSSLKINNENSNIHMKNLEIEREKIAPKLKPIDFSIKDDNSNKPDATKLYNDLLSTYNTQVNSMVNYDNNKKNETQLIDLLNDNSYSTPINLLQNNQNNIEQFSNIDFSQLNTSLNTQMNSALNSSVNNGLNSSMNSGLNSSVNDVLNSSFSDPLASNIGINQIFEQNNKKTNMVQTIATAFNRNDIETFVNNNHDNIYNNDTNSYQRSQVPTLEFSDINLNKKGNDIMLAEPSYKLLHKKVFFTFDSIDRDLAEYPNQFLFQVKFAPTGNNLKYESYYDKNNKLILSEKIIVFGDGTDGSANQTFDNVHSVYCSSVIVPVNTVYYGSENGQLDNGIPNNIYKQSYLYLMIPELRGPYYAGNAIARDAFTKLLIDTSSLVYTPIFTDGVFNFTTLKSSENDEIFIYEPVTNGKMDKMTLSLVNKFGKPFNFGIDKLFIQSFFEGNERYNGYCGNKYFTTKIVIQNENLEYSKYCSLFNQLGNCTLLNSHPIAKGDTIYFYSKMPNIEQIAYFEDYVKISKMKYNKKAGTIYIYLSYLNEEGNEVSVSLNNIIQESYINSYYIALFNKSNNKYYFLKIDSIKEQYISVIYLDSIPQFKDYNNIRIGIIKDYPRGFNNSDNMSLFRKEGYTVIDIGQTDETKWEIEINFPYVLLKDCLLNLNMYYPGTVFLIQEKMQITYTFNITYLVKDYQKMNSNLNGSGDF